MEAAWGAAASPADTLSPLVPRAAEAARRIALAEPVLATQADDDRETSAAPREQRGAKAGKTLRRS